MCVTKLIFVCHSKKHLNKCKTSTPVVFSLAGGCRAQRRLHPTKLSVCERWCVAKVCVKDGVDGV